MKQLRDRYGYRFDDFEREYWRLWTDGRRRQRSARIRRVLLGAAGTMLLALAGMVIYGAAHA